jgi:iron complex transport system permease protein
MLGALLGPSTLTLQKVLANDLLDPYLMGTLAGAFLVLSLGVLILGLEALENLYTFMLGFAGSFMVGILISLVSLRYGTRGSLLAGIGISLSLQGVASILAYIASSAINRPFLPMLMGTTQYVTWTILGSAWIIAIITLVGNLTISWKSSLGEYGEEVAKSFNVEYNRVIASVIIISSVASGVAVGCCGIIPFLGLISANVAKRLYPLKPREEIFCAFIISSMIMMFADTLASTIETPYGMLPVGAFLSAIGGVLLVLLILKEVRV